MCCHLPLIAALLAALALQTAQADAVVFLLRLHITFTGLKLTAVLAHVCGKRK